MASVSAAFVLGDNAPNPSAQTEAAELVRLTRGDFFHPVDSIPRARERGREAEAREAKRPAFRGTLAGIAIRPPPVDPSWHTCRARIRHLDAKAISRRGLAFELPGYLPPGSHEAEEIFGMGCGHRILSVERSIIILPSAATLRLVHWPDRLELTIHVSRGRVRVMPAPEGREFLVIDPVTPEGFGDSLVAYRSGPGMTMVVGNDLPITETLRVARSLSGT